VEAVLRRVEAFVEREQLFRGVRKLVVAVSGGPDSLALVEVARRLAPRYGFEVIVAHFDHKLREDSHRDLEYVRGLAQRLGLRCATGEGDVAARARELRRGIEETARELRYQFLAFIAERERAEAVATGHTADDLAETVLFRVVRGTGVRGLRAMTPAAPLPGAPALRLVRPLLELRRHETEAICRAAGLEPLADRSNLDPRFTRNRLRNEIMPALRRLNPALERALTTLAESAREAYRLLEREALAARPEHRGPTEVIFTREALLGLPLEALELVLEREAAFLRRTLEANRTRLTTAREVLRRGSGEVSFGALLFEVSCGKARLGEPVADGEAEAGSVVLEVPGSVRLGPWRVSVATEPPAATAAVAVDPTTLRGALRVRALRPGDRVGREGFEKKVSDVLTDLKVPRWERRRVLAVTDGARIVALLGAPEAAQPRPRPSGEALWIWAEPLAPFSRGSPG